MKQMNLFEFTRCLTLFELYQVINTDLAEEIFEMLCPATPQHEARRLGLGRQSVNGQVDSWRMWPSDYMNIEVNSLEISEHYAECGFSVRSCMTASIHQPKLKYIP